MKLYVKKDSHESLSEYIEKDVKVIGLLFMTMSLSTIVLLISLLLLLVNYLSSYHFNELEVFYFLGFIFISSFVVMSIAFSKTKKRISSYEPDIESRKKKIALTILTPILVELSKEHKKMAINLKVNKVYARK